MSNDLLADAIREVGGVRPSKHYKPFRTILYAQGILKKRGGRSFDEVAEHLKINYPEFDIQTEDDLYNVLKSRDEIIWRDPVAQTLSAYFERFTGLKLYDEDLEDVPF